MNNTTTKTKGKYAELKERHQQMWNELPIKYAFGNLQFSKMVDSFGLSMDENAENYYGGKLIGLIKQKTRLKQYYQLLMLMRM